MATISNAKRFQKTRRILLKTARELFTQNGYADTSTEEIVRRSRVTRGALYYHYRDKADIFAAVFEEVRAESARFIRGRMKEAEDTGADLWQQVIVGCHAFIESALTPSAQRIVHTDGPSVLDWPVVQKSGPGLALLRKALGQLMDEGLVEKMPIDPLAYVLWGTFFEAGVYIAHADDISAAREETTKLLIRVLAGLRVRVPAAYTDVQVGFGTIPVRGQEKKRRRA